MIEVVRICQTNLLTSEGTRPRALIADPQTFKVQVRLDSPPTPNIDLSRTPTPPFLALTMDLINPSRATLTVRMWKICHPVTAIEDLACMTQTHSKTFTLASRTPVAHGDMIPKIQTSTTAEACQMVLYGILVGRKIIMPGFNESRDLNLFRQICSISCSNLQQKTVTMSIPSPIRLPLCPLQGGQGTVPPPPPGYYGNPLRTTCHRGATS